LGRPCGHRTALWAILLLVALVYVSDFCDHSRHHVLPVPLVYKLASMAGKVFAVLGMAYTLIRISIRTNVCPKCGGSRSSARYAEGARDPGRRPTRG